MSQNKTVYILGAGFSCAAEIPGQAELMGKALNRSEKLNAFVKDVYGLEGDSAGKLALEDVYTPIHQAIARNEVLKGYGSESLKEIERELTKNISEAINIEIGYLDSPESFLMKFVKIVSNESISVISLNWDILLDRALFRFFSGNGTGGPVTGTVDYCAHCTGLENSDNRMIPGILARERGFSSVKLLKLHGSLNWLTCPQCDRLYINKSRKIGLESHDCRHCPGSHIQLQQSIILPTFQKDLSKFHFQHIWNQASKDLSKATKLVFIGYSFPLADFEFRSLITKHVGPNVKVDVVLYNDNEQPTEEGQRYREYFGNKINKIHYSGVEDYINHHLD